MPPDGTRRSGRISKQIAITLVGSDMEGRVFSERTKTVLLSRHGAGIQSTYKLSAEQELVIRSEVSHKEIEARVVGQIGSDGDTYIYGIAFLDAKVNFWGIDFPDLSEAEKQAMQTLLECGNCCVREIADHSDLASDVMAVNKGILRYCKKCGSSTLWKLAAAGSAPSMDAPSEPGALSLPDAPHPWRAAERPGAAQEKTSAFAGAARMETPTPGPSTTLEPDTAQPPTPDGAQANAPAAAPSGAGVAAKERENRRKHARTRVNFKACVRRPNLQDDIVACEDMSRGGLRFKSRHKYTEKTLIEVAVPYSPGDQAIFVPAQIVYVQELPGQKLYRCGVMYLRTDR
jgi:PilZ domain-containing protein